MKLSTAMRHVADLWPEFANQIGGAPSEKIRALEALVRRPLPSSYRMFLERMGLGDAGLGGGFTGSDFHIDSLLAHYETARWGVPKPLLLIGIDHEEGAAQLHTCLENTEVDDPPVVYGMLRHGMLESSLPAAQSLGELIFRYAFCNFFAFRRKFEGTGQLFLSDSASIARLEAVLTGRGLRRHPASEGNAAYFIGADLVAHYTCPPVGDRLMLLVHGEDETAISALMERLEQQTGVCSVSIGETADAHLHLATEDGFDDPEFDDDDTDDEDVS